MNSSGSWKLTLPGKEVLLGGALACVVIGGGLYYLYRGRILGVAELIEQGNRYFANCKFWKAVGCYTKAIELCNPENIADLSTFHLKRAAAYEELADWKNVVLDCTHAIGMNPKYFKALYCRAKAYANLGQKENGLEDITLLLILDGFRNKLFMVLADKIAKDLGRERAAEHFASRSCVLPSTSSIKSYMRSFNVDVFTVAPGEGGSAPGDKVYMEILKKMKNDEFDDVVSMCDDALSLGSKHHHRAQLLRGTFKSLMNDNSGALEDFNAIIGTNNKDIATLQVVALIKRAGCRMRLSHVVACYDDLAKAMEVDDTNASIWHSRAQLHLYAGRFEDAKADFKMAIKLDPSYLAPRIHLGHCLFQIASKTQSGATELTIREANATLEETIRLFPQSSTARSIYGQLLQDQKRYNEALTMFDQAISLSPSNSSIYVHKALLLLQWQRDVDEATRLIRNAIQQDAKCDIAYVTLASLEAEKGNDEEAVRLWKSSLQFVRTEAEMANTYALIEAAEARIRLSNKYEVVDSPSNWAVPPVA